MSTSASSPALTQEDRNWAMVAHLSGFLVYVTGFGQLIVPLVLWQVYKDRSRFVSREALEALNFQITVFLAGLVAWALCFVLVGFLLLPLIAIADVTLMILAAVRVSAGEPFRYPFTLRLVPDDIRIGGPAPTSIPPDTVTLPPTPPAPPSEPPTAGA
jgi:uncharacterized Tic20 family protein